MSQKEIKNITDLINIDDLVNYIESYIGHLDEYRFYLLIIKRQGIKDGLAGYFKLIFSHLTIGPELISSLTKQPLVQNDKDVKAMSQQVYTSGHISIDNKGLKAKTKSPGPLSNNEVIKYNKIELAVEKLYVNYLLFKNNSVLQRAFLKPFVQEYYDNIVYISDENKTNLDNLKEHLSRVKVPSFERALSEAKTNVQSTKENYYWAHSPQKLTILYSLLLEEKIVERNPFFFHTPSTPSDADKMTLWNGTQTELVFLFYLIFNGVDIKGSETIYSAITKLFKKPDGSRFQAKSLATIFSNKKEKFRQKVLPKHLEKIRHTVLGLELE